MRLLGLLFILAIVVGCTPQLPPSPDHPRGYVGGAISTQGQLSVPSWAKSNSVAWASVPKGITLDGDFNANNQLVSGSSLIVSVTGQNLVWSEGHYSDVQYILAELQKDSTGSTINPSLAWVKFNLKDAQGNLVTTPRWIQLASSQQASSTIPAPRFVATSAQSAISSEQLNSVLIFGCTGGAVLQNGAAEYDCNGVDGAKVRVQQDNSLLSGSGRGSWMLATVDVAPAPASSAPPFTPASPGGSSTTISSAPPFSPASPNGGTTTTTTTSSTPTNSMVTPPTGPPPAGYI